jgi:hypothetical protein
LSTARCSKEDAQLFYVNLDLGDLEDLVDLGDVADGEMQRAAANLTAQTRGKITGAGQGEAAQPAQHVHRRLSHFQVDENTWVVNLDKSARWIDEGMPEHNMLEKLLKSKKAKTAKDGTKYVIVPFQHNRTKQDMTPAQQSLLNTIKNELAKVGSTPNKIEMKADGTPQLGLVRSLDISQKPKSTRKLKIGAGPFGSAAQGPTGIPLLKGVQVYQKEIQKADGSKGVGRFVMTFRVASQKHKDQPGRWAHPGTEATNLMEEGMRWALDTWSSKIAPEIMARIVAKIT